MHIVGGLYRELCCTPTWNAVLGSGGRAAAAVSALSPGSTLHAYAEDAVNEALSSLEKMGIRMQLSHRDTGIAFSYFHPLSRPHIQPHTSEIKRQPTIQVSGETILRFGFLEGDAKVQARRAVYDPQTWRDPPPFGENGSVAQDLVIVLNELELRSAAKVDDLALAAASLIKQQGAAAVVAKGGIRGATVYERGGGSANIPAYRSSHVFKIGTGDVFSAMFAFYWAEQGLPVLEAADIASRSVAAYCSSGGQLPTSINGLASQEPVKFLRSGIVLLEGSVKTIGRRYAMEEARFALSELGTEVYCPALDGISGKHASAILVIDDGFEHETTESVQEAKAAGMPIVILREDNAQTMRSIVEVGGATVSDDFTSALYFAAWAAAEHI